MFIYALLAILYVVVNFGPLFRRTQYLIQVGSHCLGCSLSHTKRRRHIHHWSPPWSDVPHPHELLYTNPSQVAPHRLCRMDWRIWSNWICSITFRDRFACFEVWYWFITTLVRHPVVLLFHRLY